MNDQEIRAAAAQAAATLMAPMQPSPADYVAVAEVVEAFIRDGKAAAFALTVPFSDELPAPDPAVPPVATEQPHAVQEEQIVEEAPPEPEPERQADVIQMAGRAVSPKQQEARQIIERKKKDRVDSIVAQASMAKVRAHKQRLYDEAEDAGLSEYPVLINNSPMTLGSYLGSLLGS